MSASSVKLPAWVRVADLLAAVLIGTAVVVFATGGGVLWLGDIRVSIRSPARPFLFGLLVAVVRYARVRQPPELAVALLKRRPPLPLEEHQLFAPGRRGLARRGGEFVLLTVAFSALVAIGTWPQMAQMHAVSDMGDPLFSIWRLMWINHEFPRNPLNIFNANQFYPEPRTLTFSDPVLTPSLLFAPLNALGLHRIVAYNVVFLSGGVLSGVSMFYLARALTGRNDAAAVAGAIFAVYPYRVEHFAHLELQMTTFMPLVLWGVHRTFASGRLRDGLLTGAAFGAQFLSALYYGSFLMPYVVVIGGVLWLARGRPTAPLRALAAGGLVTAAMFAPVAAVYLKTQPYMGDRPIEAVQFYSAVGPDYQKAHYRSWTYGWLAEDSAPERAVFPRVAPLVLAAIALWPPLSAVRIAYAIALAVALEASFGLNGRIFPLLYEHVPPFGGIRVPARFSLVVGMTLAVLSGYGAARVFRRWPPGRGPLLALMLGVIAFESVPSMTLEWPWLEPPPIYAYFDGKPPSVIAEFPMPEPETHALAEFNYLYFSTFHWQKLVNGQSGWLPPTYLELLLKERDFPSDEAVAYLRGRGVHYITLHGAFYDANDFQRVSAALSARPDVELITAAPWEGSESRLYRLK